MLFRSVKVNWLSQSSRSPGRVADGSLPQPRPVEFSVGDNAECRLVSKSHTFSDKVAQQFESISGKPAGWLDARHTDAVLSSAQQNFLELCQLAWQKTDAKGRRKLMQVARRGFKDGPSVQPVQGGRWHCFHEKRLPRLSRR